MRLANCGKQVCFCLTWKFRGLNFHRDMIQEANDMPSYVMRHKSSCIATCVLKLNIISPNMYPIFIYKVTLTFKESFIAIGYGLFVTDIYLGRQKNEINWLYSAT